jgi:hypothetical protein
VVEGRLDRRSGDSAPGWCETVDQHLTSSVISQQDEVC